MKFSSAIFTFMASLSGVMLYAEPLVIEADGNYVSSEQIQLSESQDTLYDLTGRFVLTGSPNGPASYVTVGLVPYGSGGKPLQTENDFPMPFEDDGDGFITIDTIEFPSDGAIALSRRIKLGGSELKQVSFVVGALMGEGAKLTVTDLKMVPVDAASGGDSSSGASVGGTSSASSSVFGGKFAGVADVKSSLKIEKEEKPVTDSSALFSDGRRIIFVNADIGSDKLSGLKRVRGQADGPKRTIKSALGAASSGDQIVLQESSAAYEVNSAIRSNPGQKLVIRAEGSVVIKAKR